MTYETDSLFDIQGIIHSCYPKVYQSVTLTVGVHKTLPRQRTKGKGNEITSKYNFKVTLLVPLSIFVFPLFQVIFSSEKDNLHY